MSTRVAIALWVMALAASPVYVLGRGMPQPADLIVAAVIALVFVTGPRINRTAALLTLAWFAYVLMVNMTWWVIESDMRFLLSTAYYGFNLMTMLTIASMMMARPDTFVRWTRAGLLIALSLEVLLVPIMGGARAAGTFYNPNQLAYWSILIATCWLTLKPPEKLRTLDFGVLAAAAMLCLVSGSRGGVLAVALLMAITVVLHGIRPRLWPAVVLLGVIGSMFAAYSIDLIIEQPGIERFGQERRHDSLAARGYDRIWLFPQYIILGAGEGDFDRYEDLSEGGDYEIHSTPATILVGYGIVGTCVLSALLWWVFRGAGVRYVAYLAPPMLYGLTHNGTRATLLWAFFGMVHGLGCLRAQRSMARRDHEPVSLQAAPREAVRAREAGRSS